MLERHLALAFSLFAIRWLVVFYHPSALSTHPQQQTTDYRIAWVMADNDVSQSNLWCFRFLLVFYSICGVFTGNLSLVFSVWTMGKDQEFLEAARNGNVVAVEKLLSSKAKRGGPLARLKICICYFYIFLKISHYISAFKITFCNIDSVFLFISLRRGPGSNVQDSSGYSALHHASLNGHRSVNNPNSHMTS